ncbi:hypothetical protein FEM03_05860 [Phragmitibacter flavus]|uniref:Lipoprotein n=1 Tax=Phragmitibacter flavus TaxID=2576071 RepID=A0A5R8KHA4_9BACT|nr:hypothetical protein [Phragmitibacter flavus]TLD71662.1 hypothetical protein FEM03_05860 [Phragmitibacter flavus]
MKSLLTIIKVILLAAFLSSCKWATTSNLLPGQQDKQQRIEHLEEQNYHQASSLKRWQLASVSLGAGCLVLLIVGTALGAKTRHDAALL